MMAGVTTATIPEDWASLSGHSQEIPNGCTCLIPEDRQHEVGFYCKYITSQRSWDSQGGGMHLGNALML